MDATRRTVRLSLVIPAYNEEAAITQAVSEAEVALGELFATFEILVVDDGSTDQTAQLVEKCIPNFPHTRLLRHGINRGYGAALRTGFEASRFELVAFTDADCQFDLLDLGKLALVSRQFPIVVGRRVNRQDPWQRRFFSWGYNCLARAFLGTRVIDVDCALKVFHRDVLEQLLPESRGFFVNTEMMTRARQLGYPIAEVPVTHRPRANGQSKVSLREIPRTAMTLFRFWWREVVTGPRARQVIPGVFQARVPMPEVPAHTTAPPPSTSRGLPTVPPARRRGAA